MLPTVLRLWPLAAPEPLRPWAWSYPQGVLVPQKLQPAPRFLHARYWRRRSERNGVVHLFRRTEGYRLFGAFNYIGILGHRVHLYCERDHNLSSALGTAADRESSRVMGLGRVLIRKYYPPEGEPQRGPLLRLAWLIPLALSLSRAAAVIHLIRTGHLPERTC